MVELENVNTQGPGDPVKGSTSTTTDKTPLWDANNKYLANAKATYNANLTKFVTEAFNASATLPVIKGKRLTSIDQIADSIDKYGQDLYKQALSVYDNPAISTDQAKFLMAYQKLADDSYGLISKANSVITSDLMNAATHVDAQMKVDNWHKLLFTEDGRLKGPAQAKKDIDAFKQQKINKAMQDWDKANPFPSDKPIYWQRTDMPNPMAGQWVKDPVTGKSMQLDTRPKMKDSQEGYYFGRESQYISLTKAYENLNYDDVYKRVLNQYNKNSKTRKLSAAQQNIFTDNAGGAKMAMSKQEIIFDVDRIREEEFAYTVDLFKNIVDNGDVRVAIGSLDEKNIEVPKQSSKTGVEFLKMFFEDMSEDMLNVNRTKGQEKRAHGKITFTPIAGGDENYHAYHIKVPVQYFKDYQGTEKAPGPMRGQTDLMNKGVTVFVPKNISESNIQIGRQSSKGSNISEVEAQLAFNKDGVFSRTLPNSMTYNITLDKNTNQYSVTGNAVAYNTRTGKMDTIPINDLGIKSTYDLSVDLDQLEKDLFMLGLKNYEINAERKKKHSELSGVRDAKQLSNN